MRWIVTWSVLTVLQSQVFAASSGELWKNPRRNQERMDPASKDLDAILEHLEAADGRQPIPAAVHEAMEVVTDLEPRGSARSKPTGGKAWNEIKGSPPTPPKKEGLSWQDLSKRKTDQSVRNIKDKHGKKEKQQKEKEKKPEEKKDRVVKLSQLRPSRATQAFSGFQGFRVMDTDDDMEDNEALESEVHETVVKMEPDESKYDDDWIFSQFSSNKASPKEETKTETKENEEKAKKEKNSARKEEKKGVSLSSTVGRREGTSGGTWAEIQTKKGKEWLNEYSKNQVHNNNKDQLKNNNRNNNNKQHQLFSNNNNNNQLHNMPDWTKHLPPTERKGEYPPSIPTLPLRKSSSQRDPIVQNLLEKLESSVHANRSLAITENSESSTESWFSTSTNLENNNQWSVNVTSTGGNEERVNKMISGTVQQLKKKGLKLGMAKDHACGPNEVYLLDKEKMMLVSSGNIAHEITGMTKFEDNLLSQIKNQEAIILTLKSRLETQESQTQSMHSLVQSFRLNEDAHQSEVSMTKELLATMRKKVTKLEEEKSKSVKEHSSMRHELENLKILVHIKDRKIKELKDELEHGTVATQVEQLRDEVSTYKKQIEIEKTARTSIQNNYYRVVASQKREESELNEEVKTAVNLLENQIKQQDKSLVLQDQQLSEQSVTIEVLNMIILQKDDMVFRLQSQVRDFLNHQTSAVTGCMQKEQLIKAQYEALSNLKSLSVCQDKYGQARDTALKILQNTVYEMVERIPSCRNTVVEGLQDELSAMAIAYKPLEEMNIKLQRSLEATVNLTKSNSQKQLFDNLSQLVMKQKAALLVCNEDLGHARMSKQLLTALQTQRRANGEGYEIPRFDLNALGNGDLLGSLDSKFNLDDHRSASSVDMRTKEKPILPVIRDDHKPVTMTEHGPILPKILDGLKPVIPETHIDHKSSVKDPKVIEAPPQAYRVTQEEEKPTDTSSTATILGQLDQPMLTNHMQKDIEDILSPPSIERVKKSIPESNSTDAFIEKELKQLDAHDSVMDSIIPEAIDNLEDILAIPSKDEMSTISPQNTTADALVEKELQRLESKNLEPADGPTKAIEDMLSPSTEKENTSQTENIMPEAILENGLEDLEAIEEDPVLLLPAVLPAPLDIEDIEKEQESLAPSPSSSFTTEVRIPREASELVDYKLRQDSDDDIEHIDEISDMTWLPEAEGVPVADSVPVALGVMEEPTLSPPTQESVTVEPIDISATEAQPPTKLRLNLAPLEVTESNNQTNKTVELELDLSSMDNMKITLVNDTDENLPSSAAQPEKSASIEQQKSADVIQESQYEPQPIHLAPLIELEPDASAASPSSPPAPTAEITTPPSISLEP